MAPLPPNASGRLFVDYAANGQQHTVLFRYQDSGPIAPPTSGFVESVDDVLTAMNTFMPSDWEFIGWRYSPVGTDYTVPLDGSPTAFNGAGGVNKGEVPAYVSWCGRAVENRRARITFLGASVSPAQEDTPYKDYRMTPADNAAVSTVLTALGSSFITAISMALPVWYPYANLGYNAYWQRKARTLS